eukprot:TRINITY_DN66881_c0_g2_i2.p1 TRINITY_DN66881_c0_g2~~TRINITY_DN66881_c0_g2_i2.p1  ORF type:complete len:321 (-),score=49.60 TRINITY_DN66881_c0_g2_i2:60-1022(-)
MCIRDRYMGQLSMGAVICCSNKGKDEIEDNITNIEGEEADHPISAFPVLANLLRPKTGAFPIEEYLMLPHEFPPNFSFERKNVQEFLLKIRENNEGFKEILNTPEIMMWLKWGSPFESTLPFVKSKYIFPGETNPIDFFICLNDDRMIWGKNVIANENVSRVSNEVRVSHYAVKPPFFLMKSKDFVEKKILFYDKGTFFTYSSSIPETVYPQLEAYQRCDTIFGGSIFWKEEDKYIYYTFSQVDIKMGSMPAAMVSTFLPGATKTFYSELMKELTKRKEKIKVEETSSPPPPSLSQIKNCLLYTSPSPRDLSTSRMPSSA